MSSVPTLHKSDDFSLSWKEIECVSAHRIYSIGITGTATVSHAHWLFSHSWTPNVLENMIAFNRTYCEYFM